jgi:LPS sulfotransferase NodH
VRRAVDALRARASAVMAKALWRIHERRYVNADLAGTRRVVFVIFQPRTGSKVLVDMLNSIQGFNIQYEILGPKFMEQRYPHLARFGDARGRFSSKAAAIGYISRVLGDTEGDVVGGKIHFGHLARAGITLGDLLGSFPDAQFILLYRRNILQQFVSLLVAKATGRWIKLDDKADEVPPLVWDEGAYFDFVGDALRKYNGALESLRVSPTRFTVIDYEALGPEVGRDFVNKVAHDFGRPCPAEVTVRVRKQGGKHYLEAFTNRQALDRFIAEGTPTRIFYDGASIRPEAGSRGPAPAR